MVNFAEDIEDIRSNLIIEPTSFGSQIVAIAIAKNSENNEVKAISLSRGLCLNNEVYDLVKDAYHVECASYLVVGQIPISYRLRIDECTGWECEVPLTKFLIKKYLGRGMVAELENWESMFREEEYEITYLQIRDVY